MSKENGGSAYPTTDLFSNNGCGGMTLRDYFAGQTLAGRMARNSNYKSWEDAAKDAYDSADAMLKERSK